MNRSRLTLALLLGLLSTVALADTKITALPSAAAAVGTDPLPSVQAGVTVKQTVSGIDTYVKANGAVAAASVGGTGLSTPTDDAAIVGNGTIWQAKVLPSCSAASSALTWNNTTNVWGCNTISGGAVAGADTQIQYNNAGAFGASAGLTWTDSTTILGVGKSGLQATIQGLPTGGATASQLNILGGNASGSGGYIHIQSGSTTAGAGAAGNLELQGGTQLGTGPGGDITAIGGLTVDGNGGNITLTGRNGAGTNRNGGSITLVTGTATGTGTAGSVLMTSPIVSLGADLQWTNASRILELGNTTGGSVIRGGVGTLSVVGGLSGSTGQNVTVGGRSASGGNSNGGNLSLTAGNGAGSGVAGNVAVTAGASGGSSTTPGSVTLNAGTSTAGGFGGDISLNASQAGSNGTQGGTINITAGAGNGTTSVGGPIFVTAGAGGATSGAGGAITVITGAGLGAGANAGQLTLAAGAGAGTSVLVLRTNGVDKLTIDKAGGSTLAGALIAAGGAPVIAGACSPTTPVGGRFAGRMVSGTTGACSIQVTFPVTAPNGWACSASDLNSGVALPQTTSTTTTCVFAGTTTTGDTVVFQAMGY